MSYILFFSQIGIGDIGKVGGKNASLGELYNRLNPEGINVPGGFAVTADAYRAFCRYNQLDAPLAGLMQAVDAQQFNNLSAVGEEARKLIMAGVIPPDLEDAVRHAYTQLCTDAGIENLDVAVRSSATAEDLPTASFAGRMESFLNVRGADRLLAALQRCYASLYTDRAIKYRFDMGFTGDDVAISVGVQHMVRSDLASSGVGFTIDPDSGVENVVVLNGCWGLGENIVQGRVTPDEWILFKPALQSGHNPLLKRSCGRKEYTLVCEAQPAGLTLDQAVTNTETPPDRREKYSLSTEEVVELARWCCRIEQHYGKAMDIEWAKDGINGKLYIVQARPETVQEKKKNAVREVYTLLSKGKPLVSGIALGEKIASGRARIIRHPSEGNDLRQGEILVTDVTNPDWDPVLRKAAAIITNKGGRTSHAAIVARELGTVAVVGCGHATAAIPDGAEITVSCAGGTQGVVYEGALKWERREEDFSHLPEPATHPMLILADPGRAFELSRYPCRGVGLMRLEFAITNAVRIHPLALLEPDKVTEEKTRSVIAEITAGYTDGKQYFVDRLSEAVAVVAAAFYPREVIVRMSDFKSNEYANLVGGSGFEPHEENPMIGLRGASRYYSEFYRRGFALECAAMRKVRNEMGLTNVKLMIPFCRTAEEGQRVMNELEANGLKRGENGLEVYVMIEIPGNVLEADAFARLFDGFSIGSNDLTQLTLGLDRDSALVSFLFNEENPAVKTLIRETIRAAKRNQIKVGLCGQAPSDIPAFAQFLVEEGIDSISFNADALMKGIENIVRAENA